MKRAAPLAVLALACALFAGCGVSFNDSRRGNDFFTDLDVTGDMRAGQPLTAAVSFEQRYARIVDITCELRTGERGKTLVKEIGKGKAQAFLNGGPEATPFPGNFSLDFTVDEPGEYRVECFTPADEDNLIVEEFTVGRAPEATPTANVEELG